MDKKNGFILDMNFYDTQKKTVYVYIYIRWYFRINLRLLIFRI